MSTRTVVWIIFIMALVVMLIAFFLVRAGIGAAPGSPGLPTEATTADPQTNQPVTQSSVPRAAVTWTGSDWSMFHGGQGLLGRAPGTLAESLTLRWKVKTDGAVKSSAAISAGRVFIGSSDASLYALDLKTGARLWSCKTEDAIEGAPCVVDGRVFVGSADNHLYALDAGTGELKWKYETDGQILGSPNWTRSPDGQKTWVLVGSYDNMLYCLDARSGTPVWTYESDNYINGSPAVAGGQCVFGGCDAMIHVVSLADGSRISQIDSGSYIAASAAFLDGEVYVGNYENVFLKVDAREGRIAWKYAQSDAPFFSSPAVGEEVVVFGGRDEHVHCVRRDNGARVWTFKTLGEVNSSPALCGDKVVVGSDDGRLYLLRLTDGKALWSYEIGRPVTSSPAVAGGVVVVGCDDGHVYAFGPKSGGEGKTP